MKNYLNLGSQMIQQKVKKSTSNYWVSKGKINQVNLKIISFTHTQYCGT